MYLKCRNDEHLVLDREYLENLPSCVSETGFLLKNQTLIFDLVKFDYLNHSCMVSDGRDFYFKT